MDPIRYIIELSSFWHIGSGVGSGNNEDAIVIVDDNGVPYIPGKSIKGLVKDSARLLNRSLKPPISIDNLFGIESDHYEGEGALKFSNAYPIAYDKIKEYPEIMKSSRRQISMNEHNVANDQSLRKIQVIRPCKLIGEIDEIPDEPDDSRHVKKCLELIKFIGGNRTRGLGRCKVRVI